MADDGRTTAERVDRLLRFVSPASRIEPGLLRAARLLLPPDQADAGTEADAWQHPFLSSDSAAGATLFPERVQGLRAAFAREEPLHLRRRVLRLIRTWRAGLPEEVWFEELLNADSAARESDPEGQEQDLSGDVDCARHYIETFCSEVPAGNALAMPANDRAWVARLKARSTDVLWTDCRIGRRLLKSPSR